MDYYGDDDYGGDGDYYEDNDYGGDYTQNYNDEDDDYRNNDYGDDMEEYGENYNDNEQISTVSYKQLEQISFTNELLEDYSPLSQFAKSIQESLSNLTDLDGNEFLSQLNQILTFLGNNTDKIEHIYYKNPEMFVLGYLCINNGNINENNLQKYSKEHNINNILRYCKLIQKMLI